ncbi:DUF6294 family protein [Nocardia abscessus]|uniref:DUF6294 family protein n=1 Tax=Nocardia abscessus TaxID=120957 RepID=UPI00031BAD54|nr:DUF6294 family protein [Nocardia abscessus]MCC3331990.1 hypothetical protein [Nocardia abscessus]
MFPTHRRLSLGGIVLSLVAVLGSATLSGTASAQPSPKVFTWDHDIREGDCTMFRGARWVLKVDGNAHFTAKVTSSDDHDAWLMWAQLHDAGGQYLGNIIAHQQGEIAKFVINLPDSSRQYDWWVHGTFDPALLSRIHHMSLRSAC